MTFTMRRKRIRSETTSRFRATARFARPTRPEQQPTYRLASLKKMKDDEHGNERPDDRVIGDAREAQVPLRQLDGRDDRRQEADNQTPVDQPPVSRDHVNSSIDQRRSLHQLSPPINSKHLHTSSTVPRVQARRLPFPGTTEVSALPVLEKT